ncbi:ATP-dependent Clp protease proteolytic subunit 2 [Porphyridium purpureum]|uniref:ATP-dependent Clp protease proteolytic subunit n=1 Tax=Porphyridium purpureum TaxID=35688 RepID=A0A5J4Z4Z8_PORPP|nr:ATP-dependent Clp protease proteolytic subunit 2 [Porphyridium purpureum]|eukprot:POR0909..scf295_1
MAGMAAFTGTTWTLPVGAAAAQAPRSLGSRCRVVNSARRGRSHASRAPVMMAGSPRVPYKAPGQQDYQFIDVFERLMRDRIMFVGQDLDDEIANQMIAQLLYLSADDPESPITLYFQCPGTVTSGGFAVLDALMSLKCPISTLNMGLAAGMSALICAAGTKGKRFSLPNARYLIQAPSLPDLVRGQASDVAVEVRQTLNQRDKYAKLMAKFTGRAESLIMEDLKRDMYLTAYEAREYGLIDQVLQPAVKNLDTQVYASGLG